MKETATASDFVGTWHVELLGTVRLSRAGGEAVTRFRTTKVPLLLARLALEPRRAHAREELAALISPDAPDAATGRAHLSQTLTYLRQVLEPTGVPRGTVLQADTNYVRVAPDALTCDVRTFETALDAAVRAQGESAIAELRNARTLYTGDFLPGFYGDWAVDERNRIAARLADAESRLRLREAATPAPAAEPLPVVRLPHPLTRFFGRVAEKDRLLSLLSDADGPRLVTLTGSGGIGKTRLALEAAHSFVRQERFRDVVFVPLAEVTHAGHVARAIADALGIAAGKRDVPAETDPLTPVTAFVRGRARRGERTLLILDNLEQLEDTAAPVVKALLESTPAVSVLATSRYRVGVHGEQEFPVLPLPGIGSIPRTREIPQALGSLTDVHFFVERARLVRPDFALTDANAAAMTELCRTLEGVPLTIELAAAWVRLLSPAQIVERLGNRFDLLVRRDKGDQGGDRHHSLWATIAWSYDLLPPSLQGFFAALSLFRGSFTREAAQSLTGIADAVEPLTFLAERSLVLAEPDDSGEMHYRLLESLREFGVEQLTPERSDFLRRRHLLFCREEARKNSLALDWHFKSLRRDYADMDAAIGYAVETGDGETALELALYLWYRLDSYDTLAAKITRLSQILERCEPLEPSQTLLFKAWCGIGEMAFLQGRLEFAREATGRAHALAMRSGDESARADAAYLLGKIMLYCGDTDGGRLCYEAELAASAGKPEQNLLRLLNGLAVIAHNAGELDRAEDLYARVADCGRRIGATALGPVLSNWAYLRLCRGDFAGAEPLLSEARAWAQSRDHHSMLALLNNVEAFGAIAQLDAKRALRLSRESLLLFGEIGEERRQIETIGLIGRATAISCASQAADAARILGAGAALREAYSVELNTEEHPQESNAINAAKTVLGDAAFQSAWDEGTQMTLEQAGDYASKVAD